MPSKCTRSPGLEVTAAAGAAAGTMVVRNVAQDQSVLGYAAGGMVPSRCTTSAGLEVTTAAVAAAAAAAAEAAAQKRSCES